MLVEDKKERIVILLRHGESEWNNDNRSYTNIEILKLAQLNSLCAINANAMFR